MAIKETKTTALDELRAMTTVDCDTLDVEGGGFGSFVLFLLYIPGKRHGVFLSGIIFTVSVYTESRHILAMVKQWLICFNLVARTLGPFEDCTSNQASLYHSRIKDAVTKPETYLLTQEKRPSHPLSS